MNLQAAVVKFRKFYRTNRRLPSYQEICEIFNYSSKNASVYLVNKLIEKGILEKDQKGKLLPRKLFHIPHLGTIKAGYPQMADEVPDESIDFYEFILATPGDMYFLTVSGDSMIEAFIADGDQVIVDRNKEPRLGDIVAALVDGEWTIKYYERLDGQVVLVPANKNYPIIYPKEQLTIGGVIVSVIRKYH